MRYRNFHESLAESKKHVRKHTIISYVLFAVGLITSIASLTIVNHIDSKETFFQNGRNTLEESVSVLSGNDDKIYSSTQSYSQITQDCAIAALPSLPSTDIDGLLEIIATATPEQLRAEEEIVSQNLIDLGLSGIGKEAYVIDDQGVIYASTTLSRLGKNISTYCLEDDFGNLVRFQEKDEEGTYANGTHFFAGYCGNVYEPVLICFSESEGSYKAFSTSYSVVNGHRYFYVVAESYYAFYVPLASILSLNSTLDNIEVGYGGFTFAIDQDSKTITYLQINGEDKSGLTYSEVGFDDRVFQNSFEGYENIGGQSWYVCSEALQFDSYGNQVIGVAAVSSQKLFRNDASKIVFCIILFASAALLLTAITLILRREVAKSAVSLKEEIKNKIKKESAEDQVVYTQEEIEERANIRLDELAHQKNGNEKLSRANIGLPNAKGNQIYFSKYIGKKALRVACFGFILVAGFSYFSEVLNQFEDIAALSSSRVTGKSKLIVERLVQSDYISEISQTAHVDKCRLLAKSTGYLPDCITGGSEQKDANTHALYKVEDDGSKTPLLDQYGHQRYSYANNPALIQACDTDDVQQINVFDEDGYCIASSDDEWSENVYANQVTGLSSIIEGKTTSWVSNVTYYESYVGYEFYYYTMNDGDKTKYVSSYDYESQLKGTWTGNIISKHRSVIRILVLRTIVEAFSTYFDIATIFSDSNVYEDGSYFLLFSNDENHTILYSPTESEVGKTAADIGITTSTYFDVNGFSGFQAINGQEYYQYVSSFGSYFLAGVVPTTAIFNTWQRVPLIISLIFLGFLCIYFPFSTISSEREDKYYEVVVSEEGQDNLPKQQALFSERRTRRVLAPVTSNLPWWKRKTDNEKVETIFTISLLVLIISVFIVAAIKMGTSGGTDIFTYIFTHKWEHSFSIFSITESAVVMAAILVGSKVLHLFVRFLTGNLGARIRTIGDLIVSTLRYAAIIAGIFYCLYLFGVNTEALWTSAGIFSLVIGLGAQPLINDLISGIFIVFEGDMKVGDYVTIDGNRGQVMEIGLRTTKINEFGNIRIYNNSNIKEILNLDVEDSWVSAIVSISYDEDLERTEALLTKELPAISRKIPALTQNLRYSGVDQMGASSVDLKVLGRCKEKDVKGIARQLNRELYLFCLRNHIEIPYDHITVEMPKSVGFGESKEPEKEQKEEDKK